MEASSLTAADLHVASADIQERSVGWLPTSFEGLAVPGAVIYRGSPDASIWLHEMVHQAQMKEEGLPRFATLYVLDWVKGRYNGCGPMDSYRAVRYEVEASAIANHNAASFQETFAEGSTPAMREDLASMGAIPLRPSNAFLELFSMLRCRIAGKQDSNECGRSQEEPVTGPSGQR